LPSFFNELSAFLNGLQRYEWLISLQIFLQLFKTFSFAKSLLFCEAGRKDKGEMFAAKSF